MKITAKLEVSQTKTHYIFDLEDLNVSTEQWELMSESEKHDAIEKAVFDLPEQPYWILDSFTERD